MIWQEQLQQFVHTIERLENYVQFTPEVRDVLLPASTTFVPRLKRVPNLFAMPCVVTPPGLHSPRMLSLPMLAQYR